MNSQARNTRPKARVLVVEQDEEVDGKAAGFVCRDRVDVKYRDSVLAAFLSRNFNSRYVDLLRIVACAGHIDRRISRRPSVGWGRELELAIPVADPDFWQSFASPLSELLGKLSGDDWNFEFRKIRNQPFDTGQRLIEFPAVGEIAMAYSNGLDSFAAARLVGAGFTDIASAGQPIVLITTGRELNVETEASRVIDGVRARRVSVPFTIARRGYGFQLRESSYRTRAFVFQTMAAIAARQTESDTVAIAESGQGSLGPALTITGQEVADIRTHPAFTIELGKLLGAILESPISFRHPFLWQTKGQTLRALKNHELENGWHNCFSCAVQVRHQSTGGRRLHCGLCPNCLLRRQSLRAAGYRDPNSDYDWDFGAIREADLPNELRIRLAMGLMPLIEFAKTFDQAISDPNLESQLSSVAAALSLDRKTIDSNTARLVAHHRAELLEMTGALSGESAARSLAEVLL